MPFCRRLARFRRESATSFSSQLLLEVASLLCERVSFFLPFNRKSGMDILILGYRDGRIARGLSQFLTHDDKVYACDISSSVLTLSQNKHTTYFIVADDEALPFREQSFDMIISNLSLHNVNEASKVLTRFRSLLRAGGIFFAATFGDATLRDIKRAIISTEEGNIVARIQPFNRVTDWPIVLHKCGFQEIVVDVNMIEIEYESLYHLFRDLKNMGEGNTFRKFYKPITRSAMDRAWELYKRSVGFENNTSAPVCFEVAVLKGNNKHGVYDTH